MQSLLANETLVLGLLFLSIVLMAWAVNSMFTPDRGLERMKSVDRKPSSGATERSVALLYEDDRPRALKMLEPIQRRLVQSDPNQVNVARAKLIEAGFYNPNAVEVYFASRLVLSVLAILLSAIFVFNFKSDWSVFSKSLVTLAATAFAYYLPVLLLAIKIDDRRNKFKLGMPDALDMMLVGVEAGLSLTASMRHVVKEFAIAHPIISEQFQIVSLEFQAGRSRSEALNGLSRRMNIPITRTLAAMIVQSEQLGTSMAQTLRVMAEELRVQRMLDAEKRAAELPVKMALPLVFCIFPALMAVALVPAMISVLRFFGSLAS